MNLNVTLGRRAWTTIATLATALMLSACGQGSDTAKATDADTQAVVSSLMQPSYDKVIDNTDRWIAWTDGPLDLSKIYVDGLNLNSPLMRPNPEDQGAREAIAQLGKKCLAVFSSQYGSDAQHFGVFIVSRFDDSFNKHKFDVDVDRANQFMDEYRPHCT